MFEGNIWLLVMVSVVLSIISNSIYYRALDADKLGEIETLGLLSGIPIIIFSSVIFADERKLAVLFPAMVAVLAVVWSHWQRHHFNIAKRTLPFLIWSLLSVPAGAALSKILLSHFNPISLEVVRSGIIALFFLPLFLRQTKNVSLKAGWLLLITNILTSVAWLLFYFSYQRSGIVYTLLLFSLQPLLVYFASVAILKEKIQIKKIVAFAVILLSIGAAQLLK
jgi:drug/metabolite transporter (DMT)-like permease